MYGEVMIDHAGRPCSWQILQSRSLPFEHYWSRMLHASAVRDRPKELIRQRGSEQSADGRRRHECARLLSSSASADFEGVMREKVGNEG